jgi:phenylacetate-CoA ligase
MDMRLFYSFPYGLKRLATSVAARVKFKKKYGRYFREQLRFLMETSIFDQKRQAHIELMDFLKYAKLHCAFYNSYLSNHVDISQLPIIDKSIVVSNHKVFECEKPFFVGNSSGTSGQPLKVPYSQNVYQKEYAFWWYHRSFSGVRQGDRIATFAGHRIADVRRQAPPFWVYNATENQLFFSSYHLAERNMVHYIKELNRFQPDFIHGYPSSIYFLSRYIKECSKPLNFCPKMIVTASETTLDYQRSTIEKAFNSKVFVWYGNTELCGHITECPNGRLHVQPYHSLVRVLKNDNTEALPGEIGRIVATNFSNYAFPLINYDMKDVVRVSADQDCDCDKGGLIVDYILGRIEDYVVTPEGRYVGRLDHLFKDAKHVRNGQIIQNRPEQIIVRIETSPGYSTDVERSILAEARIRLGEKIAIVFDYDNPIEKEANGKFRFIVQNQQMAVQGANLSFAKNSQKDDLP